VYSAAGQRVAVLASGHHAAGVYAASWDGTDSYGRPVGSGTYVARLTAGGTQRTAKLTLK
jgi:flagellar hook assembly protein FlgD